jgi:putative aldouronate transport system substrate-binding protein
LKLAVTNSDFVEDFETNWLTGQIEKEYNVDLSFELFPKDLTEAATKFSLMVSSGSKLPDVVVDLLQINLAAVNDYGSKGTFIDLSSNFKDTEKMPNFNSEVAQADRDFITSCLLSPEGKIYSFPKYVRNTWNEGAHRAWVLQDWLKAVGKEVPTTTDELYDVLKAFTQKDINGNGKKDEIGIVGGTGWAQDPIVYLMNSFLYANKNNNYFDVKDGKIIASFVQPEWKAGLEYINKLVSEGLLSPLSFTQDNTQLKSLINVEKGMAGIVTAGSYSVFDAALMGQTFEGTGYKLMAPVKGPTGKVSTPQTPTTPSPFWQITKDCANVDLAVLIGDSFLVQDKYYSFWYGEPGVDMSIDPAVTKDYVLSKPFIDAGWSVKCAILKDNWLKPQNKTWQASHPGYLIYGKGTESKIHKDSPEAKAGGSAYSGTVDYYNMYATHFRPTNELIVRFGYTAEESTTLADIKTSIDEYVNAQTVAFVTGSRPLSDWDKYLSELDKMGLKKYIDANQAAFDRFGK